MRETLEEKLKSFVCQQCNECCKKPGFVYLEAGEAPKIAEYLGMSEFDFVNQYCELEERRKLVLKKLEDERCIFLSETGCQVHAAKPSQCRDFPTKWRTKSSFDYCAGLVKLFGKKSSQS